MNFKKVFCHRARRFSHSLAKEEHSQPIFFFTPLICEILLEIQGEYGHYFHNEISFLVMQILSTESSYTTWNYHYEKSKYPDDLDDTCMALLALSIYDKKYLTGDRLARCVDILTSLEYEVGGPYNTWIVKDFRNTEWHSSDPVVCCNVRRFLSSQKIVLPNLDFYIQNSIKNSVYYTSIASWYFFFKTFFNDQCGKYDESIAAFLEVGKLPIETISEMAMVVSTLCRIHSMSSIEAKNKQMLTDILGTVSAAFFEKIGESRLWCKVFIDFRNNGTDHYAQSEAYGDALILEALFLLRRAKTATNYLSHLQKNIHSTIKTIIHQPDLMSYREKIIAADSMGQLSLLASTILRSEGVINKKYAYSLGVFIMLGWVIYQVLDDCIDGDARVTLAADAHLLFLDMLVVLFTLPVKHQKIIQTLRHSYLEASLNQKQILKPNDLWKKSSSHLIVLLVIKDVTDMSSKRYQLWDELIKCYLSLRQLHDDCHDWLNDFNAGQMTWVIERAELLKTDSVVQCDEKFWKYALPHIISESRNLLERAGEIRRSLFKSSNPEASYCEGLFAPFHTSIESITREHENRIEFLAAYRKKK